MSGFYVSLIFIGILLSIISLVLILIDKKNIFVFRKTFDDKKQELVEIINDAEQMIDELNRFSDYIVSQIDVKNEELNASIKAAEQRIRSFEEKAGAVVAAVETAEVKIEGIMPQAAVNSTGAAAAAYIRNDIVNSTTSSSTSGKKKEKVIPFSNRYSEVLRLSSEGMEDTEIAKSLKMGKGEVELIIGLKK